MPHQILLCDKEVARLISMSDSWVRVQRWKRRSGQEHVFIIDPIMLGTSPRYRMEDVETWLNSLENSGEGNE